ncbi:MAG: T9SS type A sorting domain-containing protein [Candidatus Fermentibacter sp.]|nr:T9SS type A sorting domain-containing protein [Candidatus Fermentibacter sp.]
MAAILLGVVLCASCPTLDITASGLDYWVAWRTSDWELEVRASSGAEVDIPNACSSTSLTIVESTPGVPGNLIVTRSEYYGDDSSTIYSLDPATLATLGSVHVPSASICPPARNHPYSVVFQLEAQSVIDGDTDCIVFAAVRTNYTLSDCENLTENYIWQCAAILDTEDSGQMVFREPAAIQMIDCSPLIPPVQTSSSYWVSGWVQFSYLPFGSVFKAQTTGYGGSSGSGELDSYTLDEFWNGGPTDATAFCAGSCAAGAVFIWKNYEGVDQYSFICSTASPVPDTTLAMPPWPDGQPPLFAAMSDVRSDPGALLAWYDGDHVWCRYFDGQWNDWCHLLSPEEPVDIGAGFLGACSAQDGYYVAWLEDGSADPTIVYVPRSSVVGIEGSSPESGGLLLRPSSNPFVSTIAVTCAGSSIPSELEVFDLTGRLVRNLTERQGSVFLWDGRDGSGSVVPAGTYLVRGAVDGEIAAVRVVKL